MEQQMIKRTATRNFTAACGHHVSKGETYFIDYSKYRITVCEECAGKGD